MADQSRKVRTETGDHPRNLIIIASPRARAIPDGPLPRFVRDHASVLKRFSIHTTAGTGRVILSTGLYGQGDLDVHLSGRDGGIAELAALVAKDACRIAILLLDPGDPWSDSVENRAFQRICITKQARLITTQAAATRWAQNESGTQGEASTPDHPPSVTPWAPRNWRSGKANATPDGEFLYLPLGDRTMALISHDKKKIDMVRFVNRNAAILERHDRILTTGTTGWLLKQLFADPGQEKKQRKEIKALGIEGRLADVVSKVLDELEIKPKGRPDLTELLERVRKRLSITPQQLFAEKVMPLPSGPEGGDVIIADEILHNACHEVVFLHDPRTSHPHEADIRLLEHTAQLPRVYAECVSDYQSAGTWIESLQNELMTADEPIGLCEKLRQRLKLRDIIVVESSSDKDCDALGEKIARAAAGYFHEELCRLVRSGKSVRIGIAWGWGTLQVAKELEAMECEGLIARPRADIVPMTWSPLIGILNSEVSAQEATAVASRLKRFYGGKVEGFACGGFELKNSEVETGNGRSLCDRLGESDIVLTSASPWDNSASLATNTALNQRFFPPYQDAVGVISGVFLGEDGRQVSGEYSPIGIDYEGFQRVTRNGSVMLMCGGESRRRVLRAALKARLVSVLVTSSETAKWLLENLGEDGGSARPRKKSQRKRKRRPVTLEASRS